ncbi:hypothetical protein [Actinomadura sediminis]|uniref:DUF3592 domain-containing protein n=1 Tax=Actinomadura sediminis TaxID=1038904 RepID=A0ABW3ERP9_9ACTN
MKVAGLVISVLLGYFFFSIVYEISWYGGRSVGAAYGWAGEPGTLTVTGERRGSGHRTSARQCVGTFLPAGGGPVRTDLRVEVSDGCTVGRTEKARFVPGYESRLRTEPDRAFGRSAGAAGTIVAIVLVDVFCGLLGVLSAVFAYAFGRSLLTGRRRERPFR